MSKELFSLGYLPVSDFLKPDEEPRHPPVEMKLMLDENGTVHLDKMAPRETMWGKYWYRSSISGVMREQLKDVVDSIKKVYRLDRGKIFCDIASNDGYLLSCVPDGMVKVGIDPAEDTFRVECERYADLVIQDYFSANVYKKSKYGDRKVSVCTTISMFYDLEDPDQFIQDVGEILEDDGLWVVQLSYTPLMLQQFCWDNLCHEHYAYYSLFNLKRLFEKNGMQILDCELNNTNAGSFRVYAMKQGADVRKFGSPTHRDVCAFRIKALLEYEKTLKLDKVETWAKFYKDINALKSKTVKFINEEIVRGKVIAGYGASTKGATVLNYFGLDSMTIPYIADRSPYKHGLRMVGSNIPIISEDEMRKRKPDYLLVLPHHFIQEFVEREREYLNGGGKMIVLAPEFTIIEK